MYINYNTDDMSLSSINLIDQVIGVGRAVAGIDQRSLTATYCRGYVDYEHGHSPTNPSFNAANVPHNLLSF